MVILSVFLFFYCCCLVGDDFGLMLYGLCTLLFDDKPENNG
jgi:hypothetical protein